MNFRQLILVTAFTICQLIGYSQTKSDYVFNEGFLVGYPKLGAVAGSAGVIKDNYYIIENDYGGAFDFNNNAKTILSIISISTGKLIKRVNLNELIASNRKAINQILFCDVIVWKDKIVGFYTYKNSGKEYLASAIVCDETGNLLKDEINIGEFKHTYERGSFLWQEEVVMNARNIFAVRNDFHYKLSADSSYAIVLCTPEEKGHENLKFKVYKPGLIDEKEIAVRLPLKSKTVDLVDFTLANDGKIYVLTKAYKSSAERKKLNDDDDFFSDIYMIDMNDNNRVSNISLDLIGKGINNLNIAITKKGFPVCFGSYYNLENKKAKGNIQGFYSVKLDPAKFSIKSNSNYDLPDSVIEHLGDSKAVKKGTGLGKRYTISKVLLRDDDGLYICQESNIVQVTVQGSTGALNKYEEVNETALPYSIGPDGEIKWTKPLRIYARNLELATRTNRLEYFISNRQLAFIVRENDNKAGGLGINYLNENDGTRTYEFKGKFLYFSSIIQNTLRAIGNNEYVVTTFWPGDKKSRPAYWVIKFKDNN